MTSQTPSGNGNNVEKGIGEEAALNISSREVCFGNLIWVQLNRRWWLGQVVDEKTVSRNKKPRKKFVGQVLVRLYGSYKYLYVDPIKSQLEYEKIIEKYHSSHINLLGEALKMDLLHLKSGVMKTEDVKSKAAGILGAGASQFKRTNKSNKSQDMTPLTSAGESTPSRRRVKVMQSLGLMAPSGSPFNPK